MTNEFRSQSVSPQGFATKYWRGAPSPLDEDEGVALGPAYGAILDSRWNIEDADPCQMARTSRRAPPIRRLWREVRGLNLNDTRAHCCAAEQILKLKHGEGTKQDYVDPWRISASPIR